MHIVERGSLHSKGRVELSKFQRALSERHARPHVDHRQLVGQGLREGTHTLTLDVFDMWAAGAVFIFLQLSDNIPTVHPNQGRRRQDRLSLPTVAVAKNAGLKKLMSVLEVTDCQCLLGARDLQCCQIRSDIGDVDLARSWRGAMILPLTSSG